MNGEATKQPNVLDIVNKDCSWCDQQTYFLTVEGEQNGKQTVTIRKKSDNQLEGWYEVDLISGDFSKVIMNEHFKEYQITGVKRNELVFKATKNTSHIGGTSKLLNFDSYSDEEESMLKDTLYELFGNPLENEEPLYVVEVFIDDQYKCVLTVYNGPSGWAIGGEAKNDLSSDAASELALRITQYSK